MTSFEHELQDALQRMISAPDRWAEMIVILGEYRERNRAADGDDELFINLVLTQAMMLSTPTRHGSFYVDNRSGNHIDVEFDEEADRWVITVMPPIEARALEFADGSVAVEWWYRGDAEKHHRVDYSQGGINGAHASTPDGMLTCDAAAWVSSGGLDGTMIHEVVADTTQDFSVPHGGDVHDLRLMPGVDGSLSHE